MSNQVPKCTSVGYHPKKREIKKAVERNKGSKRDGRGNWVGNDRDEAEGEEEDLIELGDGTKKISPDAFEKRRKLDLPTKSNVVKAKTIPAPHEKNRPWTIVAEQRARTFRQGIGFSKFLAVP